MILSQPSCLASVSEMKDRVLILWNTDKPRESYQFSHGGKKLSTDDPRITEPGIYSLPDLQLIYKTNAKLTGDIISGSPHLDYMFSLSGDTWPFSIKLYYQGMFCGEVKMADVLRRFTDLRDFSFTTVHGPFVFTKCTDDGVLTVKTQPRGLIIKGDKIADFYYETAYIDIRAAKILRVDEHWLHVREAALISLLLIAGVIAWRFRRAKIKAAGKSPDGLSAQ